MGKGGFYKGVILGAATAIVVLAGTTALASVTAVGGPFLIGHTNDGVASTSELDSAPTNGAALRVMNTATTGTPYGIIGRAYGPSAAIRGFNSSNGPECRRGRLETERASRRPAPPAPASRRRAPPARASPRPARAAPGSMRQARAARASPPRAQPATRSSPWQPATTNPGSTVNTSARWTATAATSRRPSATGYTPSQPSKSGAGLDAVGTGSYPYALKATSANQTAIAADATSGGSALTSRPAGTATDCAHRRSAAAGRPIWTATPR